MIDLIMGTLMTGWTTLYEYVSEHVLTCLIPAFL